MMKSFRLLLVFLSVVIMVNSPVCAQNGGHYTVSKNIPYYAGNGGAYRDSMCRLDIATPENSGNLPVLLWFHGGGLSGGDKDIPAELMNQGFIVVSANYRLSPRVSCPAYIEDAAAALAWVFGNITRFGGDTTKIFVSGHSAGGYLSMMIILDKKWLAPYGINPDRIAGLIPLSGQTVTHYTIRQERGIPQKQPLIDSLAPLWHVRADAPEIVLVTGDPDKELLGRYEENAYLRRMLLENGHKKTTLYPLYGFNHGGMLVPGCIFLREFIKKSIKK